MPVHDPADPARTIARHLPRVVASFLVAALAMVAFALSARWLGPLHPLWFALPAVASVAATMGAGAGLKTAAFSFAWLAIPWLPTATAAVSSWPMTWMHAAIYAAAATATTIVAAACAPHARARRDADDGPAVVGSLRMLWVTGLATLLPFVVFVVIAHHGHERAFRDAELRVDRAARIAQEHASKVFDTSEAILGRVLDIVADRPDPELRARQDELQRTLRRVSQDFPHVQSIWVFGAEGRPVATNRVTVVPADSIDISERDYFTWHQRNRGGLYVSEPHVGKATLLPFFDTSRRREDAHGAFLGTASVSLSPGYFVAYYAQLSATEPGLAVALIRRDGVVLVRNPPSPNHTYPAHRSSVLQEHLDAGRAEAVIRSSRSMIDGLDRVLALRAVDRYPLYIAASVPHAVVVGGWHADMTLLATVLFPMSAVLASISWVAYRRSVTETRAAMALKAEARSRSRAESALLKAQKTEALAMLTGSVAHDFNNLLAVVANNAHLIERLADDPRVVSLAGAIRRAVNSGTHLTRQLLSLSRRQALRPESLDLRESLPQTLELLRTTVGSRTEVELHVRSGRTIVRVDRAELELSLLNLALNARDAMPDGGRLTVTVDAPDDRDGATVESGRTCVAVRVSDTGTGMGEAVRRLAFEPLFTTKPEGRGTGLGLSQVLAMCQQAGGGARIDSEPGCGTTVTLLLPTVEASPADAAPAGAPAPVPALVDREVLLVEDNVEVARTTQALLESFGARVVPVDSAPAALAAIRARATAFDAVLSDIMLPGDVNGLALARHVRQLLPSQPVVLMTGYASEVHAAVAAGFEVLPKPCVPEQLVASVERAMRRDPAVSG